MKQRFGSAMADVLLVTPGGGYAHSMTRTARTLLALLVLALIVAAGVAGWQYRRAEKAEEQFGLDAGRVLSAVFTKARELRVARLTGRVAARSSYDGWFFDAEQRTRAPFSVNYFIDLKQIGRGDYDWDRERNVMIVRIPDVLVEQPSIDMAQAQVTQNGFWMSRKAGVALQKGAAEKLANTAAARAKSDENIGKARAAAVEAVRAYVQEPLRAAEFGTVAVEVRFPWEGRRSSEQMDRSRRPEEVLGNAR